MKIEFLNLGKQPLANSFLTQEQFKNEFFFDLKVQFDTNTKLVSLVNFVPPEKMFNEDYAYSSSCSKTMADHFFNTAQYLMSYGSPKILEIGSNDGVFIGNVDPKNAVAVEPCANFANITRRMGYTTYDQFWTEDLAQQIVKEHGTFDIVYAANCMCHIQDIQQAFNAVNIVLNDAGRFIFEDPYLLEVIKNSAYDQFYDEHAHIFSIISLYNLLKNAGFRIYHVDFPNTHGGSLRIYADKRNAQEPEKVSSQIGIELGYKLDQISTYETFASAVRKSKLDLQFLLKNIKSEGKNIIGYGATSKSTVIYNYCQTDTKYIDYIIDTTPAKQGKYSPGVHIPIVPPTKHITCDYAFLGAWNYKNEILSKEKNRDFSFITHVPRIMII